jgi:hypothetical protein
MVIGQAGPVLKAVAEYQNHKKKGRRDANL